MKKQIIYGLLAAALATAVYAQVVYVPTPQDLAWCDMDFNGQIDKNDVNLIVKKIGTHVVPGSLGNPTGTGVITITDARTCTTKCNNNACSVTP